ncbi:MAG TPA: alanine racemase [Candidatus Omnitrophota bacterium]|nr:alanine racemase [Candidatus Omnitrophota bacterium]
MQNKGLFRPTWVEIDLAALEHNFKQIKKLVGNKAKVLCVVKADAYGHGMVEVSKKLVKCGADYFGVASIDEAIKLRKSGIKLPILILELIPDEHAGSIVDYNLTQGISTEKLAQSLNNYARKKGKIAKVHIKIDTGMGRLGVWHEGALELVKKIKKLKNIKIEGIYTHFPCADTDRFFTNHQVRNFDTLIKRLNKNNIDIPFRHCANSVGVIDYKCSHLNLVRPGLMLYGIYPKENLRPKIELQPVMSFKTKVLFTKKIPQGRTVSYGRTYIARRPTSIATLPVGYSDGYLRVLSNKAEVLIKGARRKIAGRICMDQSMVDLNNLKNVSIGDEVVLVGKQGKEKITLEELASLAGTISYELACSIGKNNSNRLFKNT